MIHELAVISLDVLIASFEEILVLVTRFTLPEFHIEGAGNVLDTGADLVLSEITDDFAGGSPFSYDIEEGVDKFTRAFHTVDVNEQGLSADIDLGVRVAAIDGGDVSVNHVCADWFVASLDIHSRIRSTVGAVKLHARGKVLGVLCGAFIGLLDDFDGLPEPELGEARIVPLLLPRVSCMGHGFTVHDFTGGVAMVKKSLGKLVEVV